MSVIDTLYNATATIKRKTVGTYSNTDATIATGVNCVFRPVKDRAELFNESHFGKEYHMYCDNAIDVKVGDTVVISSVNYGVRLVNKYEDLTDSSDSHLKVVLEKLTRDGG